MMEEEIVESKPRTRRPDPSSRLRLHRMTVTWPADLYSRVLKYGSENGTDSFSEGAVELIVLGLDRERKSPSKWTDEKLTFPKDGPRATVNFPRSVHQELRVWTHKHMISAMSDAIAALVQRGLEDE